MNCKDCPIADYCSNIEIEMSCEEVKRRYFFNETENNCDNQKNV